MTAWRDGNAITLLENGADFFPALERAIDEAQREIFLETYIFEPDSTGRRIADALARAVRRGVAVQVLVDGFGARSFVRTLRAPLVDAGVAVQVYRPERRLLLLRRRRLRRLHRKLAVMDGRVAFVGGINIVDDLEHDVPGRPRFDYAVRIEGPLTAPVLETVHRLWRLVAWANLRRRQPHPLRAPAHTAAAGDMRAAFLSRDNLRHRRDIEDAYLEAIAAARSEVVIACAYFFPGRRFRQALVEAAGRGVEVTLLLQGVSDHPMQAYATRALYPFLLGAGIRLLEYHHSYLHAKVAVVDSRWATVGSSNIDPFSLLLAREANVVIDDARFARALRESLQRACIRGAQELRGEDWSRLPRLRRAASWVAYQLVRFAIGVAGYGRMH